MSPPLSIQLSVSHRYEFPAERVFDAWLDAEFAATWMFATQGGQMVRAETDPKVGGKFTFTDRRDGEDVEHTGEYLEIDRPRRLVFTFGIPAFSAEFDRVTIDIEPLESGCLLTLTHALHPEFAEYVDRSKAGWTKMLAALDEKLQSRR